MRQFVTLHLILGVVASGIVAADDPPTRETADQRFDKLSDAALHAPEKADWNLLRQAFAETTYYHPYDIGVSEKLKEIAQAIGRGEHKQSEAKLLQLVEAEKAMNFEPVAMLMMLYKETDQPKKAEKYKKILHELSKILDATQRGDSIEKPIPVLFLQEEYLVINDMAVKSRGSSFHEGHNIDFFIIAAEGDKPGRSIFFDTDLPRRSLSKRIEPLLKPEK